MYEILENLVDDFEEFTGIPKMEVSNHNFCKDALLSERKEYGPTSDDHNKFQINSNEMIRERIGWTDKLTNHYKEVAGMKIDDSRKGVVLDCAAGIGSRGIPYALGGWKVYFVERNKQCLDFAKRRCEKYGLTNVEFSNKINPEWEVNEIIFVTGYPAYPQEAIDLCGKVAMKRCRIVPTWDNRDHSIKRTVFRNQEFNFRKAFTEAGFVEKFGGMWFKFNEPQKVDVEIDNQLVDDILDEIKEMGFVVKNIHVALPEVSNKKLEDNFELFFYLLDEGLIEPKVLTSILDGVTYEDEIIYVITDKGAEKIRCLGDSKIRRRVGLELKEVVGPINLPMWLDPRGGGINPVLLNYDSGRELIFMELIDKTVKEDFVCLDCGANIGYTSLAILKNIGPNGFLYAVEPDPRCLGLLDLNIEYNGFQNRAEIVPCALSNKNGSLEFWIADDANLSSVHKRERSVEKIEIPCFTLEEFLKDRRYPNFIKMDIEGHEVYVLDGGFEYFKSKHEGPTSFLIECHPYAGNPRCEDPERDFVPVLEKYFEIGFKPKYAVAGCAPDGVSLRWDEVGCDRVKEVESDGFTRVLYENITEDDILHIACREPQQARSFMIERI